MHLVASRYNLVFVSVLVFFLSLVGLQATIDYARTRDWCYGVGEILFWRYIAYSLAGVVAVLLLGRPSVFRILVKSAPMLLLIGIPLALAPFLIGVELNGQRSWIDGPWGTRFYVGYWAILLTLPQLSRWTFLWARGERRVRSTAGFTVSFLLVNITFYLQPDRAMLLLFDMICLLMGAYAAWKTRTAPAFAIIATAVLVFHAVNYSPLIAERFKLERLAIAEAKDTQSTDTYTDLDALPQRDMWRMESVFKCKRNVADGGLFGAQNAFDKSRCDGGTLTIGPSVLQVVAYRFGAVGLGIVLALTIALCATLLFRTLSIPLSELHLLAFCLLLFLGLQMFSVLIVAMTSPMYLPAYSFPFVSFGHGTTLSSFAALGVLLSITTSTRNTAQE